MSRDWNDAYLIGDTPWDKGYASPPLAEFLKAFPVEGRVLVPGCGRGHDVRCLAAGGAEVVGLDIAPSAIRAAEAFPRVGSESYAVGDFLNLAPEFNSVFDWVFEHTCLCAISPAERVAYARAVCRALRPGGNFLAVFFRKVGDYRDGGPPHPIDGAETDRLFGEDFEIVRRYVPKWHYPGRPEGAEEVCWMRRLVG